MRIVVTTPTGNIGSRVVQVLLQAGARPTLLARHPARLDPRVLERADVVRTDLADSDAVVRAAGFGDKQIEGMAGMSAVMRPDFVPEDKRSIITTTPTTLAAWAHARLRPLLQAEPAA
jgi:nucleoside-diphosphate-sugar epimerase